MAERHARRRRPRVLTVLLGLALLSGGYAAGARGVLNLALRAVGAAGSAPPARSGPKPLPETVLIDVPPQSQLPALVNGCEVTSLSMLLHAVGHPVSYLKLAQEQPYDPTKRVLQDGRVVFWGNPNVGFVGSVTAKGLGYGIYHGPITRLLNRILPGRALDLTGKPFSAIERVVASGRPVEVWTTTTLRPTTDWGTWQSPEGPVRWTPKEHAVLVVGYDRTQVFINNPLNGRKAQAVQIGPFIQSWKQLGQQAVTVRAAAAP